ISSIFMVIKSDLLLNLSPNPPAINFPTTLAITTILIIKALIAGVVTLLKNSGNTNKNIVRFNLVINEIMSLYLLFKSKSLKLYFIIITNYIVDFINVIF